MNLLLRHMQAVDIPAVVEIDRASFDPPWPARSYAYEVHQSTTSHMVTLLDEGGAQNGGFGQLLARLLGRQPAGAQVLGYGGLWHIADEAHISTIASHPAYRGRSFGEILLAGMVQRAISLRAAYVVLEVRVSNEVAQKLYLKYGFEIEGVKKGYYQSNNEDAYDMRLALDQPGAVVQLNDLYEKLQARVPFRDQYSRVPHPRLGK